MTKPLFSAKFPPRKPKNENRRSREYLTPNEVEALIKAARHCSRNGHRDAALILISYRHALRVSEVSALRWDQVDLKLALLHVHRMKKWSTFCTAITWFRAACTTSITSRIHGITLCF